ncbi:MAG: hypothetical protein MUC67_12035, partial [Acidobacteria bacterium]|nr:hypothetical protein [Acidobacteriota bacterium]
MTCRRVGQLARGLVGLGIESLVVSLALAQGAAPAPAAAPPPSPLDLATALVDSAASAQSLADAMTAETGPPVRSLQQAAEVRYNNRQIAMLRANVAGLTPTERAEGAARRLDRAIAKGGDLRVASYPTSYGSILTVGSLPVFALTTEDLDEAGGESIHEATVHAQELLNKVVAEATEEAHLPYLLRAAVFTVIGAALAAGGVLLLLRLRRSLTLRLSRAAEARLAGVELGRLARAGSAQLFVGLSRLLAVVAWAGGLGLLFLWLTFALQRFPYTRPWGEQMGSYVVSAFQTVGVGIVASIPKLLVVLVVALAARLLSRAVGEIFRAVEDGRITASDAVRETTLPTRRMLQGLIWIFALVLAFPYLPGSDSAAFKGVSVMLG